MSGHLEARAEASTRCQAFAGGGTTLRPEPAMDIVGAELERHAVQAEQAMARVRRALQRLDSSHGEATSVLGLAMARKAAFAAAAADSALVRLADAARGSLDKEEVLDLLLAARSTLDALRESADVVEMAGSLVTLPASGPEM